MKKDWWYWITSGKLFRCYEAVSHTEGDDVLLTKCVKGKTENKVEDVVKTYVIKQTSSVVNF